MKLKIVTCRFPVDENIQRNCDFVLRQMPAAKRRRTDVVHFSQTCLFGYSGAEFSSFKEFDWELLDRCTR